MKSEKKRVGCTWLASVQENNVNTGISSDHVGYMYIITLGGLEKASPSQMLELSQKHEEKTVLGTWREHPSSGESITRHDAVAFLEFEIVKVIFGELVMVLSEMDEGWRSGKSSRPTTFKNKKDQKDTIESYGEKPIREYPRLRRMEDKY